VAKIVESVRAQLGREWIPELYREKVRLQRTRSFHLDVPGKENRPEILHTLLGIELKIGNRRFACPDLATARYLRVFARIGCANIAVPYDITKISLIADELETAWHHILLVLENEVRGLDSSVGGRIRSALLRQIREEIDEIGPGDKMPAFDRETKQRKE
jgi:hypothetical protein